MRTRRLLQPRVGAVLALVDPALSGRVEAVHDFRVAARSLRASLRLLTRKADRRLVAKTSIALKTSIRALADVRDRDVGRSLILKAGSGSEAAAVLRRRMLGLSESDRRLALARCQDRWPRDLDRRLIQLLDRGEPGLKIVIRRTRAEAWRQRRRALELIRTLGRRPDPDRLHGLRITVRRLRYALEVLAEVDRGANVRLMILKPIQSALGNGQDRIVLSRWLLAHSRGFLGRDPTLAAALRAEGLRREAQSRKAHASFLKLKARNVLEGLALNVDPLVEAEGRGRSRPRPKRSRARASRS